ncbi:uncharacterized protein LOC111898515 isoform X1 [Lactuca sativa]|uniref:Uncharacterized protein n=1 Tax=Lactuca sativa TaxID=4236 RepID=A0A9R1VYD1_LACSA|nr:uncharacterized protein LOC111898515 isoform X1 [Lactuca sativa]XP_023750192.1 uncharacterized protein LOC111898515 isoform X1 [Lactuca sativa]KAJ0216262.1 hypothetical protein LSAT_V11C300109060 [Lactuca sativa]
MIPELVGAILIIVIKPFSLFKLSCMAGVRGTCIVINTWVDILSASIYFHVNIFWRFMLWTVSIITLPTRALGALHREKQLQAQLSELQERLDSLAWDRRELQEHIRVAIKEHEMMELVLGELEEEHDVAIHRIQLLETELQNLKDENLRLKEVDGKSQWDTGSGYGQKHKDAKVSYTKDGISPWKLSDQYYKDVMRKAANFEDENKDDGEVPLRRSVYTDDVVGQRREVAVSQSLFSAMLSVLVGMIIWEAKDPCMPLVTALFMVVGMSLKSVVQFFSTIKNKPASDAVALLSLNWFILGTLTYPTLPRVARLLMPFFIKSSKRAFGGFFLFLT